MDLLVLWFCQASKSELSWIQSFMKSQVFSQMRRHRNHILLRFIGHFSKYWHKIREREKWTIGRCKTWKARGIMKLTISCERTRWVEPENQRKKPVLWSWSICEHENFYRGLNLEWPIQKFTKLSDFLIQQSESYENWSKINQISTELLIFSLLIRNIQLILNQWVCTQVVLLLSNFFFGELRPKTY